MRYLLINSSQKRMPRAFMQTWLTAMWKLLIKRGIPSQNSKRPLELTLVFVNAVESQKLNKQFRNKNYPTDVLSFAGNSSSREGVQSLGELILCPTVIEKQAREHQFSFRQELGYMLIHGVLHLLGYDHEGSAREARIMFALQDEIFDQLCRKF